MGPHDVVFHELDVVIKFNKEDLANDLIHLGHYSWPPLGRSLKSENALKFVENPSSSYCDLYDILTLLPQGFECEVLSSISESDDSVVVDGVFAARPNHYPTFVHLPEAPPIVHCTIDSGSDSIPKN